MTINWYEMKEKERIKKVYCKYTIMDFWKWWREGQNKIMEVRIRDYEIIREVAERYNLNYSPCGVYIYDIILLKQVIQYVRDKAVVWFGINPRKRNWNKWGFKN